MRIVDLTYVKEEKRAQATSIYVDLLLEYNQNRYKVESELVWEDTHNRLSYYGYSIDQSFYHEPLIKADPDGTELSRVNRYIKVFIQGLAS